MPNPTPSGRAVALRMRSISGAAASDREVCSPVTPSPGDQIDESGRMLSYQLQPFRRAGRSGEEHGIEAICAETADRFFCFLDTQVGQQNTINPRLDRIARELLKAVAQQRIHIAEEQDRNLRLKPHLANDVQEKAELCAGCQGPFRGALDDRTIGNRIGKWNSQLNQIGSAALERKNQINRYAPAWDRRRLDKR